MRADDYLQKLIALGHRVAVCEQIEDPAEAKKRGVKSVVRRDVIRLVTPGTLTEDKLLDAAATSYLMALGCRGRKGAGGERAVRPTALAWIDISTGVFRVDEAAPARLAGRDRAHRAARADRRRAAVRTTPALQACLRRARPRRQPAAAEPVRFGQRRRRASRRFFGVAHARMASACSRGPSSRPPRRHRLCREHADGRAPAAARAGREAPRRGPVHRPGDARQSRADAHAVGRAATAACCQAHRPHRHRRRVRGCSPSGCVAAHRSRSDRARGSMRSPSCSPSRRLARGDCGERPEARARHGARAVAAGLGRGGPRDLGALATGLAVRRRCIARTSGRECAAGRTGSRRRRHRGICRRRSPNSSPPPLPTTCRC